MSDDLDRLIDVVDEIADTVVKMTKQLHGLEGRVDVAYKSMEVIGKRRVKMCFHQQNGYCMSAKRVILDPSKVSRKRVLEQNGKFYAFIDWVDCYLCADYTPSF